MTDGFRLERKNVTLRQLLDFDWVRALLAPQVDEATLKHALDRVRLGAPPPVIWLFGKVQSGKTSIVRALTGAERAQIGDGFQPCTRWAARYVFPNVDFPLAVFLDTRGLGEVGYDPQEDLAALQSEAHMLVIVVKAMDMALEQVVSGLQQLVRVKPDWPIVVTQTTLHEGYPATFHDHLLPYPFTRQAIPSSVPVNLARALTFQRSLFANAPVKRFVPLDFTLPEDGFSEPFYGREALLDAFAEAHPHAVYTMLRRLPALTAELKTLHFRQAQPHILTYALAASAIGATPLPLADLPIISTLQLKMLHTIASFYRQPLKLKTFVELITTVGAGMLLRQGARSLLKVIPGLGNAVSGIYAGATTYALGCALCFYYQAIFDGHVPTPERLKLFFEEKFTEGTALLSKKD